MRVTGGGRRRPGVIDKGLPVVQLGTPPDRMGCADDGIRLREVGPTGALLVRPDTIVARRGPDLPRGPGDALDVALTRLAGARTAASA